MAQPASAPVRPGVAESPTAQRTALGNAETVPPAEPPAAAEPAGFDVDMSEPAPAPEPPPAAQPQPRPNQPAPTVMFESAVHGTVPSESDASGAALPAHGAAAIEPEPPAEPSPRPIPTRGKSKGKPVARKGGRPKPGFASSRQADDEEDTDLPSKPASSKAGLIIFLALVLCGAAVIGVVILRGRTKTEPAREEKTTKSKPLIEPEPVPSEAPAALAPAAAEPTPAPKPTPADKPARAEKPVREEKPAAADRARAEPSSPSEEPPPAPGKPTEEDYRKANEAYQRGNTKLFQGDTPGAIAEFKHALKLNPKDPAIHRGLGLAYAQSGKTAEAIRHLKAYVRAAPKANDRAIIERKLEQLRNQ
jgi:hypothetical protein